MEEVETEEYNLEGLNKMFNESLQIFNNIEEICKQDKEPNDALKQLFEENYKEGDFD